MDKKDEFNLDEFKDLLNDVPDAGDFDLESIIAEVEGRAPAEPKAEPVHSAPVHSEPAPAAAERRKPRARLRRPSLTPLPRQSLRTRVPHALPRARPKPQSTSRRLRKSEPKNVLSARKSSRNAKKSRQKRPQRPLPLPRRKRRSASRASRPAPHASPPSRRRRTRTSRCSTPTSPSVCSAAAAAV